MLALLGFNLLMAQNVLPDVAEDRYKEITDETVLRIQDQFNNITLEIQQLGRKFHSDDYTDASVEELEQEIKNIVDYSPFVDSATIIETDGWISGYYPSDLEEVIKNENFSNRDYMKNAITTKEIYISHVVSAVTNRFVVVVAIPILDGQGDVSRVVNLIVRIGENPVFNSILENIQIGEGYAYLVDRNGHLISHPEADRIGEDVTANAVVQNILNKQSGYQEVVNTQNIPMLASYQYIPILNWGVVAQVPVSYTHVYFETFQHSLYLISFILFLFLSIFTALYTKQILKPIKDLELAVGQVAKGNFSKRLELKREDNTEIGRLSRRFNEMAEYIEDAREDIVAKESLVMHQKEFLRTVLDSNPNFIYAKNSKGQFTLANQSIATFFCTTVEEMVYNNDKDVNPNSEQVERHSQEEQIVIETLKERVIEEELLINNKGEKKWVKTTIIPLVSIASEEIQVLYVSNDLTERKLTEEIIRKSDKMSVVGELAAGVAHEIRNPLTSIQGFLQFMKPKYNDDHYFDIMLSEVERINLIVSEMLVLSRPQVEKRELKDIRDIGNSIIYLFESQANLNNVQIYSDFDADIPLIWCEENQLKQVFVNILKNAIESMPDGGEILVQMRKKSESQVKIRFIDQGIGIDQERVKRLGEPFYSTKEKGTGLGLMISYRIIASHKGSIEINSEKGKGTTVDIELPISFKVDELTESS